MKKSRLLLAGTAICMFAVLLAVQHGANWQFFAVFAAGAFILSILYFREER